jgi:hypothetical protein
MPTHTLSAHSFIDQFESEKIVGLVPINLAAEMLGVKRSTLLAMESALFIKVEGLTETLGLDVNWLRNEMRERRIKDKKMDALTVTAVRNHIEQRLACNGFSNGNSELVEYSADLMVPFGLQHQISNHRGRMGKVLGDMSMETFYDHHVILSAVVVNKTGKNKGLPSSGFWNLVEALGFEFEFDDKINREAFWRNQIELIRDYISANIICQRKKFSMSEFPTQPRSKIKVEQLTFAGSLSFIDEGYSPLEVSSLQNCSEGVRIFSSYTDTDGVIKFNGAAFKTGTDTYTRKNIYQTGYLPLLDANNSPIPETYAKLQFTMDQGHQQRYVKGIWTDGDGEQYEFAGDIDCIQHS